MIEIHWKAFYAHEINLKALFSNEIEVYSSREIQKSETSHHENQ